MRSIILILLLLLTNISFAQNPCLGTFTATLDGVAISFQNNNGQLSCGQSYTFCYTVNTWNTTNANWFDGIALNFSAGWDITTLTPGPPPPTVGNSTGDWGWYNQVQGTSGTNIGPVGPGFFFDLNNNGNPGDDFGDFATVGPWTFCWTISTLSPPNCVNGQNLSISVSTWGDSQVGSWGSSACGNNAVPVYNWSAVSCPSAGIGSSPQICQNSGNIDLFQFISGYDLGGFWTDPIGTPTGNIISPQNSGIWVYSVNGVNCPIDQSFVDLTIVQQPDAGLDTFVSICQTQPLYDLNLINTGGVWLNQFGNPISGVLNPPSSGEYTYVVQNPPCPNDTSVLELEIWQMPNPGQSTNLSTCPDGIIDLFDLIGQYSSGGVWTRDGNPTTNFVNTQDSDTGTWVYTVFGDSSCLGESISSQVNLEIFEQPISDFLATPLVGCVPLEVQFSLSQPAPSDIVIWNVNGDIINGNGGSYIFQTVGNWEIENLVTSVNGCQSTDSVIVSVFNPPTGEFSYSPDDPLFVGDLEVFFYPEENSNFLEYSWTLNGGNFSETNPWIPPYQSGIYDICLTVTDTLGCQGQSCKEIELYNPLFVWVPNTFTPDGDGVNDTFLPVISQLDFKVKEFLIFNRWGEQIYHQNGNLIPWDGSINNSGEPCQTGVYIWKLVVTSSLNTSTKTLMGHVTLLR